MNDHFDTDNPDKVVHKGEYTDFLDTYVLKDKKTGKSEYLNEK